jgi:hypothetical protein
MSDRDPNYHCPLCGTLSTLIISPLQAFCTNTEGCQVLLFNPSLPDGGMSDAAEVDLSGFEKRD